MKGNEEGKPRHSPKVQAWKDDKTPAIRVKLLASGIRSIPVGDRDRALVAPMQVVTVPAGQVRRFCETADESEWQLVEPKQWPFKPRRNAPEVPPEQRPGALQLERMKQAAQRTEQVPKA